METAKAKRSAIFLGLLVSGLAIAGAWSCSSSDDSAATGNKGSGGSSTSSSDDGSGGSSDSSSSSSKGSGGSSDSSSSSSKGSGGSSTTSSSSSKGSGGSSSASSSAAGSGGSSSTGSSSKGASYSGSVSKDSTFCTNGYCSVGDADSGTGWKGYAFTYNYSACTETQTFAPTCGTSTCFESSKKLVCVNGNIPASYDCGLGIGFNLNQASGATAAGGATARDFKLQLAGAPDTARVGVVATDKTVYCETIPSGVNSAPTTIKLSDLTTNCYTGGSPQTPFPDGTEIKAIQIEIPGDEAAAQSSIDFCLVDIE